MTDITPRQAAENYIVDILINKLPGQLSTEYAHTLAQTITQEFEIDFDFTSWGWRDAGDCHERKVWDRWLVLKSMPETLPNERFESG